MVCSCQATLDFCALIQNGMPLLPACLIQLELCYNDYYANCRPENHVILPVSNRTCGSSEEAAPSRRSEPPDQPEPRGQLQRGGQGA